MVPPVATVGEGQAIAKLVTAGGPHGVVQIRGNFFNVVGDPLGADVYFGVAGVAASSDIRFPLDVDVNPDVTDPEGYYYGQFTGDWTVTEVELENLRAGRYSIILRTATQTAGEIRGQIVLTEPPPGFFPLASCP